MMGNVTSVAYAAHRALGKRPHGKKTEKEVAE
jgi:hypothetical protein